MCLWDIQHTVLQYNVFERWTDLSHYIVYREFIQNVYFLVLYRCFVLGFWFSFFFVLFFWFFVFVFVFSSDRLFVCTFGMYVYLVFVVGCDSVLIQSNRSLAGGPIYLRCWRYRWTFFPAKYYFYVLFTSHILNFIGNDLWFCSSKYISNDMSLNQVPHFPFPIKVQFLMTNQISLSESLTWPCGFLGMHLIPGGNCFCCLSTRHWLP